MERKIACKNLVEISPIVNDEDQKKIIDVLKKNKAFSKSHGMIMDIIEKVEESVKGKLNSGKLYIDLLRYFGNLDKKGEMNENHRRKRKLYLSW